MLKKLIILNLTLIAVFGASACGAEGSETKNRPCRLRPVPQKLKSTKKKATALKASNRGIVMK